MKKPGGFTEAQLRVFVTHWILDQQIENKLSDNSIYMLGKIKGVKQFVKDFLASNKKKA